MKPNRIDVDRISYQNRDSTTTDIWVDGEIVGSLNPQYLFLNMAENCIEDEDVSWLDDIHDCLSALRNKYNV